MRLTDDEVALASEAVACKHWDLLPGMLMDQRGLRVRYEDGALRELFASDLPVFADRATMGCLLALARRAWGFDDLSARRCSRGTPPGAWRVGSPSPAPHATGWGFDHYNGCVKAAELQRRVGIQPTEEAALVAALKAAP